jgi:hypothetical protein
MINRTLFRTVKPWFNDPHFMISQFLVTFLVVIAKASYLCYIICLDLRVYQLLHTHFCFLHMSLPLFIFSPPIHMWPPIHSSVPSFAQHAMRCVVVCRFIVHRVCQLEMVPLCSFKCCV